MSQRFSPMFSFISLIVLALMFSFVILIKVIFVYGGKIRVKFTFFAYRVTVVLAPFSKKAIFAPIEILWHLY